MARSKTTGRDHVDGHLQQSFQVLAEPNLVEKRSFRVEVDKEVNVAQRSCITSGNRPEYTNP